MAASLATYSLIVLGGWVRITGSGLGCGDHWPLCNGRLIPSLDDPATLIEWGHRLVAALVSFLTALITVWAFRRRRDPGWSGRFRASTWAVSLLTLQVLLGAVTVWLQLPPWSIVLHLGTAMAFLALLLSVAWGRADGTSTISFGGPGAAPARWALALALLSACVVLLGALVANLGAAPACQGFPLCNGSFAPGGDWRISLHWIHRLSAYVLVLGALTLPLARSGRREPTAWIAAGLAVTQVAVAAVMVIQILPAVWRGLHLAVGAAVFAALVAHADASARQARPPGPLQGA